MIKYEKSYVLWLLSLLGIFLFMPALVNAGEFFVDKNNTTGTEDGTSKHPYNTIQEAIAVATGGGEHTVRVAQGDYTGNVGIDTLTVHLLGGFQGGTPADYAGGAGGVFDAQDPVAHVTRIQGDGTDAVVKLQESGTSTLDGFVVTGGTGFTDSYRYMGGGVYVAEGSPTLSRNIIEGNDTEHVGFIGRGGGIAAESSNVHIIGNTVRNNISGLGGGISVNGGNVVIEGNTVQDNTATEDHGGGLYVSGNSLTVTNNRVLDNEVGQIAGYGWGGGIAVIGEDTTATLSYNHFSGNFAPTAGGGVFLDDGATVVVSHELIHHNETQARGGAGVYVDGFGDEIGTTVTMSHCTIADNLCPEGGQFGGNGLLVEYYSVVTVQNSIFWGNGGDDFYANETSQITLTYTDSEETVAGTGNISSNPLFANSANKDYHLQSTTGRWDPAAGGGTGGWVLDQNQSPCIDKGNPQSTFANEPAPNGNRINMGRYGNTEEASKSLTSDPVANIRANGSDGPVTVSSLDQVSINISLDPGDKAGQNADWWIAVSTPFAPPGDWYTYVYPAGWQQGINLCVQAPLVNLPSFEVFNMALPVGTYTFFFALDESDGMPAGPWLGLDSVEVTVQ